MGVCNGKRTCRISTRNGNDDIFSRNPCIIQRHFVSMKYMCESRRGNMLRSFIDDQEEIIPSEEGMNNNEVIEEEIILSEEGIDNNVVIDGEKYSNYIKL